MSKNLDMDISFQRNIDEWRQHMSRQGETQVAFATSKALNDTVFELKQRSAAEIKDSFNNPVSFTQRGLRFKKSTKANLHASVYFNTRHNSGRKGTSVGRYLQAQIFSGVRRRTRWEHYLIRIGMMAPNEYAVPGSGAQLNAHGNVKAGTYNKIVSQLRIGIAGIGNESDRKRFNRRKRKTAIFVPQIAKGPQAHRLARGIWEREGTEIKPLFLFITDTPNYEQNFDFHFWARTEAEAVFPTKFANAFDQAMRTAR